MTTAKYVKFSINASKGPDPPVYIFSEILESPGEKDPDKKLLKYPKGFPFGETGLRLPDWVNKTMFTSSFQFYMGPPGSGAPIHFHDDALNFLVHGRKRWFLQRPIDTRYMRVAPLIWLRNKKGYASFKKTEKIYECVQQPGEALFVPHAWGHGVLNVETSIGGAMEISRREEKGDSKWWVQNLNDDEKTNFVLV